LSTADFPRPTIVERRPPLADFALEETLLYPSGFSPSVLDICAKGTVVEVVEPNSIDAATDSLLLYLPFRNWYQPVLGSKSCALTKAETPATVPMPAPVSVSVPSRPPVGARSRLPAIALGTFAALLALFNLSALLLLGLVLKPGALMQLLFCVGIGGAAAVATHATRTVFRSHRLTANWASDTTLSLVILGSWLLSWVMRLWLLLRPPASLFRLDTLDVTAFIASSRTLFVTDPTLFVVAGLELALAIWALARPARS
jgi:hypothetical protein